MKTLYVFILAIAVLLYVDALPYKTSKVTIPLKKKRITRHKARKFDRRITEILKVGQQVPDVAYFGELTFGTTSLDLQFDTGSADMWVIDDACLSFACEDKPRYDPKTDENFEEISERFKVKYFDGGEVNGSQGTTIVKIGSLSIRQQFGLAETLTDNFETDHFSGMLGMAFNEASVNDQTTLMFNLFNDETNNFDAKQFSFKFGRLADGTESELTIGGVNPERFVGELTWTNLSENNEGHWVVPLDDCFFNGQPLNFVGRVGNIDSGSNFMEIPLADALQVYSSIEFEEVEGRFFIDCDSQITIGMKIGGVTWNIDPRDFIIEVNDECIGAIFGVENGPDNEWALGIPFMKNVYSVFDLGEIRVGLGQLA